jgi:hypothetical protein
MKKKLILLSIILFPSLFYLFFEMTSANFKKMAYFGPKTLNAKGDTVYYKVPDLFFLKKTNTVLDSLVLDTVNYPIYVILFLDEKLKKDGYKLTGLYDFLKYKSQKIKNVPIVVVSDFSEVQERNNYQFDSLKINMPNFSAVWLNLKERQKVLATTYFKQKPYYVLDYFMVLVDKQRHIRGFYDPTFNAEVTRMAGDYEHLKIRDGYAQTQKQNDIKQK